MNFPTRVVIRTDASLLIGTGHVMRCMALAHELAKSGAQVQFMCRNHDGNLIAAIKSCGFEVISLPKDVTFCVDERMEMPGHYHWLGCDWQIDVEQCRAAITDTVNWIIVDHYALDHRWENAMRDKSQLMICIDDLADRRHDCDFLLDQSFGRCKTDYRGLVPENAGLLLGPKYALLRPEFARCRAASLTRRNAPQLRHILITMGGVDHKNFTSGVLSELQNINLATLEQITVVMGPNSPWHGHVSAQAKKMPVPTRVLSGVDNMAELMSSCDLAIGAGGSTTWERCALGVPSILLVVAHNQRNIAKLMKRASAAFVVDIDGPLDGVVQNAVLRLENPRNLKSYSKACSKICDGTGVTRAIAGLANGNK